MPLYTLKQDWPAGLKLMVRATSKHAVEGVNKAESAYDSTIYDEKAIGPSPTKIISDEEMGDEDLIDSKVIYLQVRRVTEVKIQNKEDFANREGAQSIKFTLVKKLPVGWQIRAASKHAGVKYMMKMAKKRRWRWRTSQA